MSLVASVLAAWFDGDVSSKAMLRLESHEDYIEIDLLSQETADSPGRGDSRLAVLVTSSGFSGRGHPWVTGAALRSFCTALVALEHNRRGEAAMESMSPGEMVLRIGSVDSCGHMAVEGSIGCHVHRDHSNPWHAVHFGFEFDPSQLTTAVATEWVRRRVDAQSDQGTSGYPRLAKVHSKGLAEEYQRLGWTLMEQFRAPGEAEPTSICWNGFTKASRPPSVSVNSETAKNRIAPTSARRAAPGPPDHGVSHGQDQRFPWHFTFKFPPQ
jgi:hypothetical protein